MRMSSNRGLKRQHNKSLRLMETSLALRAPLRGSVPASVLREMVPQRWLMDLAMHRAAPKALGAQQGKLEIVRTHDRHLPIPMRSMAQPVIERDDTTTMRVDHNNVDIDVEMANMAKNQLYYNSMATQLGGFVTKMKNVMTSGQS
jgi:flagellar basal-body rod protein FlgB